jgi:hypothetical protein
MVLPATLPKRLIFSALVRNTQRTRLNLKLTLAKRLHGDRRQERLRGKQTRNLRKNACHHSQSSKEGLIQP